LNAEQIAENTEMQKSLVRNGSHILDSLEKKKRLEERLFIPTNNSYVGLVGFAISITLFFIIPCK
jgi:hypothetical protein